MADSAERDNRLTSQRIPTSFRQAEMFSGLSDGDLRSVASRFKRHTYQPDEMLLHEGAPAKSFHLVSRGRVKVVQTSAEGLEVILHIFEPGGIIGALPTVGEDTYPASAVAMEAVETYAITSGDFQELMLEHPRVTRNLLLFATRMLQNAHQRLREMATERVERRIARSLSRLASQLGVARGEAIELDAPLTRQDLAELSGTTLYTVSRTLKEWERRGILRSKRERVTILEPHQLIVIAEDLPEGTSSNP